MRHAAYKIEVGEPFSVVVNLVCYLGQLSEDDCTHSHPLDLKMTKDFFCLSEAVSHFEVSREI